MAVLFSAYVAAAPVVSSDQLERGRDIITQVQQWLPFKVEKVPPQLIIEYADRALVEAGFSGEESTAIINVVFGAPNSGQEKNVVDRLPTSRELADPRSVFFGPGADAPTQPPATALIQRYVDP